MSDAPILRKPDLLDLTGLSDRTVLRLEVAGQFPRRVKLSARTVGWRRDDVLRWLAERPNAERSSKPEAQAA